MEAPRDRARVTRVELVDAARRVFLRSGFHGASLDEISAEAGYTTGAVCSRFGGKDELFLAVLDEAGAVAAPVRVTPVAALERGGRRREVEVDRRPVVAPTERRRPAVGSRPVVAGSDASIVLGALPVGLQLWESAGRDPAGLALGWSNRDGDREVGEAAARAALAGEAVDSLEPCADGVCRVRARPLGDGRVVVSFEDVTELAASERLSAAIVASLQQALIVVDTAGRITRSNEAAAALCGVSLGALVGSQLRDLPIRVSDREGRPLDPTRSPIHRALAGETVHRMLVHVARADGSERWVEVASCPLTEPDGRAYGAMSTYADVTGRVERERRIRHQAETDDLTGLANRRALQRMLTASLARAEAHGLVVGVLMLDLDGFKAVNDRHGHAAGDAALREVAARLRRSVRDRDMVARTGGDEFVVVLADLSADANAAHDAAERVRAAFVAPLELDGVTEALHAAVGVARFPTDGADLDELLAAADRDMYSRKQQ